LKRYKLKLSDLFVEDVLSTTDYIKNELDAPQAAKNLAREIKLCYKKLKENPFMYPSVPNNALAAQGYRFTLIKNYLMFYTVTEREINIIRFLYGYRDWVTILMEG